MGKYRFSAHVGRGMVAGMQGVTAAIVGFIFLCVAFPRLVRNKTQFYAAVFAVVAVILFDALAYIGASSAGLRVFCYAMVALLQIMAIVVLILATGGQSLGQLSGEMGRAFEVIRRGEEEKEIIIPIGKPEDRPRPAAASARRPSEDEPRKTYTIDDDPALAAGLRPNPAAPAAPAAPPANPPADKNASIPLD